MGSPLKDFLDEAGVVIDVRSPAEFNQGRIPGSFNLPILDDQERALVGITYKQNGRNDAVDLGLKLVGPKISTFVSRAKEVMGCANHAKAKVYCWRGGMRSSSMAWLFQLAGIQTITLKGGYKTYRRHVLEQLNIISPHFIVLGGLTGSGKTAILQEMKMNGEQVLDLEEIAQHKGSSYGMLKMGLQPRMEQFENEIIQKLLSFDLSKRVWVEDESRMIGCCKIPDHLFNVMKKSPLIFIEKSMEERVERLLEEYAHVESDEFLKATQRIAKKLGGNETKEIMSLIEKKEAKAAVTKILNYYDRAYMTSFRQKEQPVFNINLDGQNPHAAMGIILTRLQERTFNNFF